MSDWQRGYESNAPPDSDCRDNGFEDRGGHQAPITLQSAFAITSSGRDARKVICKGRGRRSWDRSDEAARLICENVVTEIDVEDLCRRLNASRRALWDGA